MREERVQAEDGRYVEMMGASCVPVKWNKLL